MTYEQARAIIWLPDHHELAVVAEAALAVLGRRGAESADAHQASYLITTLGPHRLEPAREIEL